MLVANHLQDTQPHKRASIPLFSLASYRIETSRQFAFTRFGLSRREVFNDGVRFDEASPFNGPVGAPAQSPSGESGRSGSIAPAHTRWHPSPHSSSRTRPA
jgi:hypothetical protein